MKDTAECGDRVRVQCLRLHHRAKTEVPRQHSTLEFTVGSREVIAGISRGVVGMAVGDVKQLVIPADKGFGVVRRELIRTLPSLTVRSAVVTADHDAAVRQRFPEDVELYIGKRLTATASKSGRRRRIEVIGVNADTVIVDANHPLAGKILKIEVQLLAFDSFPSEHGEFDLVPA